MSNLKKYLIVGVVINLLIACVLTMLALDIQLYTSTQFGIFKTINGFFRNSGEIWLNVTALGDAAVLLGVVSLVILIAPKCWAAILGAVPLATLFSRLGKELFAVPRPAAVFGEHSINVVGPVLKGLSSFPSGHSITIAAVVTICAIHLYSSNIKHRHLLAVGLVFAGFIVGLSHVAVGAHWPFDVLAGIAFGILAGLSGIYLAQNFNGWWLWMKNERYNYIHAVLISILCIMTIHHYLTLPVAWLAIVVACVVLRQLFIQWKNSINSLRAFGN